MQEGDSSHVERRHLLRELKSSWTVEANVHIEAVL